MVRSRKLATVGEARSITFAAEPRAIISRTFGSFDAKAHARSSGVNSASHSLKVSGGFGRAAKPRGNLLGRRRAVAWAHVALIKLPGRICPPRHHERLEMSLYFQFARVALNCAPVVLLKRPHNPVAPSAIVNPAVLRVAHFMGAPQKLVPVIAKQSIN